MKAYIVAIAMVVGLGAAFVASLFIIPAAVADNYKNGN
jgi:hypothetical protein